MPVAAMSTYQAPTRVPVSPSERAASIECAIEACAAAGGLPAHPVLDVQVEARRKIRVVIERLIQYIEQDKE
jgi:hypothetical protein